MTDHEAIKIISRMILDMEYPNGKYHDDFTKEEGLKHLALYRAKSALQEREERSKGCRYCSLGADLKSDEDMGMNLFNYAEGMDFSVYPNFCPMCGRPLKGGNDNGKAD